MSDRLDKRLKTALNETRLLILGVQVLLGFQLQSFFQDQFDKLPPASQTLSLVALLLLFVSVALLITPSLQHRITDDGRSSGRLVAAVTRYATLALIAFAAGIGLAIYVVVALHFGRAPGVAAGSLLTVLALFLWFGLELAMGLASETYPSDSLATPLATRVEQLLVEARIIIPGRPSFAGVSADRHADKRFRGPARQYQADPPSSDVIGRS